MHIQLEAREQYAVQAYTSTSITIDNVLYEDSLIVHSQGILTDWPIKSISALEHLALERLLDCKPEIIIIGHETLGGFPPKATLTRLEKASIGLECMSIGAACRTYNVLLSEHRSVVLGVIV